jgi:hypothetical protein
VASHSLQGHDERCILLERVDVLLMRCRRIDTRDCVEIFKWMILGSTGTFGAYSDAYE